jgi:hypothetical protein
MGPHYNTAATTLTSLLPVSLVGQGHLPIVARAAGTLAVCVVVSSVSEDAPMPSLALSFGISILCRGL